MNKLPRLDKKILSVGTLDDIDDGRKGVREKRGLPLTLINFEQGPTVNLTTFFRGQ